MRLKNKTILITGAAQRIGRSLALSIAHEGGDVIIHHNRSKSEAESLQQEIKDLGQVAHIAQADFSDSGSLIEFTRQVFSTYKIFAVVNNASIFTDLNWSDTNLEDWELHQRINLTAPFIISQAFAKAIPESSSGRIINLLDWRALRPGADHLPYTISKTGLAGLTKSMALALAPQITVNGIALGAILPPISGKTDDKNISDLPIPRWANISELEDTILFLLTGPSYITGEIIHLDGGKHLT